MQTTLTKRKTVKSPLNIWAGAGAHDVELQDIVDEIDPAASSTLSKEGATAMSKRVWEMDHLCSTNDVDFKKWSEEHEFSVGVDLSGMVDGLLASPPYNIRRDRMLIMRSMMYLIQILWKTWKKFREMWWSRKHTGTCSAPLWNWPFGARLSLLEKRNSQLAPWKILERPCLRVVRVRV